MPLPLPNISPPNSQQKEYPSPDSLDPRPDPDNQFTPPPPPSTIGGAPAARGPVTIAQPPVQPAVGAVPFQTPPQPQFQQPPAETAIQELPAPLSPAPVVQAASVSQPPAIVQQAGPPVTQRVPKQMDLIAKAEELGFYGLKVGFGTFPIIVLKNEKFRTSDGVDLGGSLVFIGKSSKPKYLFATNLPQNDTRSEALYSYDGTTDANSGNPVSEKIQEWKKAGIDHVLKEYVEVTALMGDGSIALLSIPPQSISRLSNFILNKLVLTGMNPENTWVRAFPGDEVSQARTPFIPWEFEIFKQPEK